MEKFVHRNRLVAQRLEQIAASVHAARLFERPLDASAELRTLLAAQERLLNAAERMLDRAASAPAGGP